VFSSQPTRHASSWLKTTATQALANRMNGMICGVKMLAFGQTVRFKYDGLKYVIFRHHT